MPRSYWRGGMLSLAGLAIALTTFVLVQHVSFRPPHTHASIPPREKPSLPVPSMPSIAVLPFTNLSGNPEQEYFNEGIANQLIEDLSRLPGLFVIARNSSFAYKGTATNERQIGRELGVRYLLEGSVRKAPDRVRVGVDLVDAGSGTEMWAQHFERPIREVFEVQDEIVSKVVMTLGLLVKLDGMRLPHSGKVKLTDNVEAFDDYLRSNAAIWGQTKDDNERARQWALRAAALDPEFSAAYSQAAWTYRIAALNLWSSDPQRDLEQARTLAQKALSLDDSNVFALGLLAELD